MTLTLISPNLTPIDNAKLYAFNEAYQESNIPFLVEARDWARLPESFHPEIERKHVVLIELFLVSKRVEQ